MRVKQYVVETMPEAMLQIRKDLGSDAVILSTKEVKVGGVLGMFRKKRIEVVAAIEKEEKGDAGRQVTVPSASSVPLVPRTRVPEAYRQTASSFAQDFEKKVSPQEENPEIKSDQVEEMRSAPEQNDLGRGAAGAAPGSDAEDKPRPEGADFSVSTSETNQQSGETHELMAELRDIKRMMNRLAQQGTAADSFPEDLASLKDRLQDQELWSELSDKWFEEVLNNMEENELDPEGARRAVQQEIVRFLIERIDEGIRPDTRIVYVAGPTGVGKTTTIAKLAAEQMFNKQRKVGFITSDTYRISAVEQLRTYASILNVPLEVVQSPGDTQRAISRLQECDLIFMDTAGRNYRNELLVSELQSLLAPVEHSETYLVISLTSKSRDMIEIANHFSKYGLDKVIFTKMDETGSYGPMFNLLHQFPIKLAYLTNGQNVPDHLLKPDADQLADMLLGETKQ
ncbi:flagellar biosynthesis protein FlhF [Paenibacillus hubeiensis]|uniref:flagellar biosynthesis protein FlhF n=1 Tax=Paenibacillus hubeiensis TaxID=3077330 RepID=UPI0031BA532E